MVDPEIQRRNRYSKLKGAKFEVDVVSYLRSHGFTADRISRSGKNDQGDAVITAPFEHTVIECKAEKSINLSGYLKELETEVMNHAIARGMMPHDIGGVVVVKARGKSIGQSYVVTTLDRWIEEKK